MKIHLTEPQRGYTLLQKCIALSNHHPRIEQFAPIGADIFTLIYPIFLIVLYLKGIIQKKLNDKEGALFIFLSCLFSILINILIQTFFLKNRPNVELFNEDVWETLLHGLLPSSSFPSDHTVVGISIAVATLIRGYKLRAHRTNKKWNEGKGLIFFWYFLIACALMMWFCRIITVIHRPSDILGGIIIGTAIPLLLTWKPLFKHLKTYLITPLVKFQERIFSWFKHK